MRKNSVTERWWQLLPVVCLLIVVGLLRVADVEVPVWLLVLMVVGALIATAAVGTIRDFILARR